MTIASGKYLLEFIGLPGNFYAGGQVVGNHVIGSFPEWIFDDFASAELALQAIESRQNYQVVEAAIDPTRPLENLTANMEALEAACQARNNRLSDALLPNVDPARVSDRVAYGMVMGGHAWGRAEAQRLTEAQIAELRGRLEPRSFHQEFDGRLGEVQHRIVGLRSPDSPLPQCNIDRLLDGRFTVVHLPAEQAEELRQMVAQIKTEYSLEFDRCCQNCAYFMKGLKLGEPNICNAFHSPHQPTNVNECSDFENRFSHNH